MAEKNKLSAEDVLEGVGNVLGLVGSVAARRVVTPVKAAVEVARLFLELLRLVMPLMRLKHLRKNSMLSLKNQILPKLMLRQQINLLLKSKINLMRL